VARARAFLWLVYRYLEGPDAMNPFDDDYARANPGKAPLMPRTSSEEAARENIDPPEEIEWGKQMGARRSRFLKKLVESEKKGRRPPTPPPPPETPAG
jgi:Ino eighty subunit 1